MVEELARRAGERPPGHLIALRGSFADDGQARGRGAVSEHRRARVRALRDQRLAAQPFERLGRTGIKEHSYPEAHRHFYDDTTCDIAAVHGWGDRATGCILRWQIRAARAPHSQGGDMVDQDTARGVLGGAYDMHVHSGPDVMPRKFDDVALAQRTREAGMAGFVLKSHYVCTADRASLIRQMYPDVKAYGGIVLN